MPFGGFWGFCWESCAGCSADVAVDKGPDQRPAEVLLGRAYAPGFKLESFYELGGGHQLHVPGGRRVHGDVGDGGVAEEELYQVGGGELDPVPALVPVGGRAEGSDREVYGLLPRGEHRQQGAVPDAEQSYSDRARVRTGRVVRDEDVPGRGGRVRVLSPSPERAVTRRGSLGRGLSRGPARRARSSCGPIACGP